MGTEPDVSAQLVDATGTIVTDLSCHRCGYNLRGLNQAGRCPECGVPIGLSCHGDLLRYCEPTWLDTLARGASLILWGILAVVIAVALGTVLAAVMGAQSEVIVGVLTLGGSLVGLYGAWLITEPDPSGYGEDKYVTDRKLVRIALLIGIAGSLLGLMQHLATTLPALTLVLGIASGLASLVSIVGEFAKLTYFAKLARRIPDANLAKRAHSLRWVLAISLGIMVIGGIGAALMMAGGGAAPGAGPVGGAQAGLVGFGCVAGLAGLVYFVVAIFILILIYRLGKAFRLQAQLARQLRSDLEAGAGEAT